MTWERNNYIEPDVPGKFVQNVVSQVTGTLRQVGAEGDDLGRVGGGASEGWDPAHYEPECTL